MGDSGGLLPALPGSFHAGTRGTCYHYRDAAGRQHKKYVRRADLDAARAELDAWRRLRPPAWAMRQTLAALKRAEGR